MKSETRKALIAGVGGCVAILGMAAFADRIGVQIALVPFATSIVLVMSAPDIAAAQPRSIVGGHVLSACVGFCMLWLFGSHILVAAVAVGLSISAMMVTRTLHPPAGINALIVVTQAPRWTFLIEPVVLGSLLLVAFTAVFLRLTRTEPWPISWWRAL